MNGSLRPSPSVVDIKLKRGPAGLGFNIVGGVDQQYVVNDNGIYVAKIKEDGAAALDGRLQEGDKILAINGVQLEDLMHKSAVDLFRMAGEDVDLRVLKKLLQHDNGSTDPQPNQPSPALSLGVLLALAGAAVLFSFVYTRHIRKHF
ncbi:synaptojanin-2-binding protein [Platichthys flesus]|uniref:synaptojanin-2-binding protein n=1 Tax=Platichthys flesus TaxID=8260 RepID=UPI002DBD2204|nr:synaptojanin-2-binding protein [Platichthys flesus]